MPYVLWFFVVFAPNPVVGAPVATYQYLRQSDCEARRAEIDAFIKKEGTRAVTVPCEKRVVW